MHHTLTAPAVYTQGQGILSDETIYGPLTGSNALILGGDTAIETCIEPLQTGITNAGIKIATTEPGVIQCTHDTIDRLTTTATKHNVDLIIGVGGGVALDTSKAVAHHTNSELAIIPTIASSDAPCSRLAVIYDTNGAFDSYLFRDRNPDLVAVDTGTIARAPTKFLRHGMGDALATRFEAEAAATTDTTTIAGGAPTATALLLATQCFHRLEAYGADALTAVERNSVTPAVDQIVEATTLLSGIGFESGGLGAAHAFHKGFAQLGVDTAHGRLVGFGTIAQLVLEGNNDRLDAALTVARSLEIAPPLAELGVTTDDEIQTIADRACQPDTTMSGEPMPVTPDEAADAIRTADELLAT